MASSEGTNLRSFLNSVMELLISKDYVALERLSGGKRLSAFEINRAISDYGKTLVMPQADQFDPDIVSIRGDQARGWSIVLPLFTAEEGSSDLSLELTVHAEGEDSLRLEIEDLRVR